MRNGLPYYKAYPRDFIEGTIGLPFEIKCTYRVILDLIYIQGGNLPDNPRYIAGQLGCSIRKWKSIREYLIEIGKLHVSGEFLTNNRADKELETLAKLQEVQRENASGPRKNNGLQKPRHSQPEPEPEPLKKEAIASTKKPTKPRKKPEVPIPENWVPSDKNIADAETRQFSAKEIEHEADSFRNYHTAKGSLFRDWDAAWRTWLGNARKFGSRRMAGQASTGRHGQGGSIASIVARRWADGSA